MKKRKAISTIKEQKEKLLKIETSRDFILWKTQTIRFVELFLKDGGRSEEIILINSYRDFPNIQDANYDNHVNDLRSGLSKCLDSLSETIKKIGVPKKEWNHFLTRIKPELLWVIFVAIITLAFFAGKFWVIWNTK